jgi:hypothetical protein
MINSLFRIRQLLRAVAPKQVRAEAVRPDDVQAAPRERRSDAGRKIADLHYNIEKFANRKRRPSKNQIGDDAIPFQDQQLDLSAGIPSDVAAFHSELECLLSSMTSPPVRDEQLNVDVEYEGAPREARSPLEEGVADAVRWLSARHDEA